ncbi:MAG: hypothetical protein WAR39_05640 [Prevotella sp.]
MKHIVKYITGLFLFSAIIAACSPEEFVGADQKGLPTMEGVDFQLTVDQTVNQMTAVLPATENVYPVWIINGAEYSTLNQVNWSNKKAGTYSIELHLANRNGISQAAVKKDFTFDKTLVDWKTYNDRLSGKAWRIDHTAIGHIACGPSGTSGVDWWKAQPEEKKDWGVYDDRLTFAFANAGDDAGSYAYSPGDGGTMYVNTGCTQVFPSDKTADGKDYMAKVSAQTTDIKLESGTWKDSEGKTQDCVYLVFPNHTQFPYISNDDQWNTPRFRVEKITAKSMELVYDNGNIAWHFILTSDPDVPKGFGGYTYSSDCNLWKSMHYTNEFYYANGDGWTPNTQPIGFKDNGSGSYTVTLPEASSLQWQAQVKFLTDMTSNAATNYDFSVKLTPTQDIKGVTVKLVKNGDDNTFYFADRVDLTAGDPIVFYKDNMAGIDMDKVNLILDFGGAPAGTDVKISDVVLKEHDCDDGAGHPSDVPVVVEPYAYDTATNLWKTVDAGDPEMFFFYADANWAPYANSPGFVHAGNKYTLTYPLATAAQWQCQTAFYTNLTCKKDEVYDFGCIMNPNVDLKNVTVKLVKYGGGDNDNIFFFVKNVNLTGGEDNVIKFPAQVAPADMDRISLFFDFGGNPENTEVVIKNIVFQKTAN